MTALCSCRNPTLRELSAKPCGVRWMTRIKNRNLDPDLSATAARRNSACTTVRNESFFHERSFTYERSLIMADVQCCASGPDHKFALKYLTPGGSCESKGNLCESGGCVVSDCCRG